MSEFKISPLLSKGYSSDILENIATLLIGAEEPYFSDDLTEELQIRKAVIQIWKDSMTTMFPLACATVLKEYSKPVLKENLTEIRQLLFTNMAKFTVGALRDRFRHSDTFKIEPVIRVNLMMSCIIQAFNIYQIAVIKGREVIEPDSDTATVAKDELLKLVADRNYSHDRDYSLLINEVFSDPELKEAIRKTVKGPMTAEEAQKSLKEEE